MNPNPVPLTREDNSRLESDPKTILALLALLLLAALALRLYALDAGLWYDEILTYVRYARLSFGQIITTYEDQNQHFLYTLLAHASFLLLGESGWALRLPAVLFGVGSIGAVYLLGRQVANAREGLLAAALLTFSYQHIWFSQNARGYSGVLFWTLLAGWLFVRALENQKPREWLCFALAAALGVYTHMTMLFVIAGQFIIYLFAFFQQRPRAAGLRLGDGGRWRGLFLGFGGAGVLTLLLHAPALPQILSSGGLGEVSTVPTWTTPLWTLLEFVNSLQVGFAGGVVALAAVIVFGAGVYSYARTRPIVLGLFFIPVALCAALVLGLGHHLWPRFFYFAFGLAALLAIRGAMFVGQRAGQWLKWSPHQGTLLGTVLCLALILASATSLRFVYAPKQDYEGARAFVERNKQPGDAVALVGLASYPYRQFYKTDWEQVTTLAALDALRARAKRTWVVYTFPTEVQSVYPEIMASIQRDFVLVEEFYGSVGDGAIYVRRAAAPR